MGIELRSTDAGLLLRPYLPRLLLQWASETPAEHVRQLEASVAFVDISGFTKLSERLARLGKVGAEELSDAINTCFTRLLAVAYGSGGGLIKFGGDALLLLFTGTDHQVKACRAAAGMRRALREIGALDCSGARVTLRMSVGVHSGLFQFFLVGESHRELIVTGPAASQTVMMEGTADAGEIVVSEATAAALPSGALGDRKGVGWLLRKEPPGMSLERVEAEAETTNCDLREFVPVSIQEHLLANLHEPEHRRVTIAFLHFDGTDELIARVGANAAADELGVLVTDVQRAAGRYEVTFLASDIDRDGGKIILATGTPVARGNDEERMLLAVREIIEGERAIAVRIGVNSGYVFTGDIGPAYRRTYTVMGDAVNLAARVMAKAEPGQILATDAVLNGSRTNFETTALEPFMVKGKAKPVQAYAVGPVSTAKKTESEQRIPLIGREHEMSILQTALDSAHAGEGQLVQIVAEPGMGKSRLIEELRSRAAEDVNLTLACELYQASSPYFPFTGVLRSLIGIPEGVSDERASARMHEVITALAPQLLPWAPLIGPVLGIEGIPPTQETRQLEDRFRRARANESVFRLMAALLRTPTLMTIEDAHWMDEASADLLRYITSHLNEVSWLVCVTRRDVTDGFIAADGTTSVRLQPLDAETAAQLLTVASVESPFPAHEIAALAERSGGNPLFLKELLAAARTAGIETLPDTVEGLITARIDRLAPAERNLLRYASVIGRSFPREYLSAVLDEVPEPDAPIWKGVSEFLITQNGTMSFVHALIRDGAYEGLPFRLRRRLHSQVGSSIERAGGETPDEQAELLSLHFFHAGRFVEAWRYSLVAAERAKAIYANVEAIEFYERALASARHVDDLVPLEVARVQEALGDVMQLVGAFTDAAKVYGTLRRSLRGDPVAEARLQLKVGQVQGWLKRLPQALRWLSTGIRTLEGIETPEAAAQRATIMGWYARYSLETGRFNRAIKWCEQAIAQARLAGEKAALADAYRILDVAYVELGRADMAVYSDRARALYEEIGDLSGVGAVLNNLGGFAYWRGEWDEALEIYRQCLEVRRKTGDTIEAAFATNNLCEVLLDQGRLDEAEELYRDALRVFQAAGWRMMVAGVNASLGRIAWRTGRVEEGERLLTQARDEARDLGAHAWALDAEARLSEFYVFQGQPDTALRLANEALEHGRALSGETELAPMINRVRGYALMQLGELDGAAAALDESLSVGRKRNAPYEIAMTLRAIHRLNDLRGVERADDPTEESEAILARLHVTNVPEVPLLEHSAPAKH